MSELEKMPAMPGPATRAGRLRPVAAKPPGFPRARPLTAAPEAGGKPPRPRTGSPTDADWEGAPAPDPSESAAEAAAGGARTGKARNIPIEEAILGLHRSRKGSVEEAVLEIYHAAISMRRAEAVARALWGPGASAATLSEQNQRIADRTLKWLNRPIHGDHAYVFLGMVALKGRWGGDVRSIEILAAVGVNAQGFREVLGVAAGAPGGGSGWREFLGQLRRRGLAGVRLIVSAPAPEVADAIADHFPEAAHQVCLRQVQHELLARIPPSLLPGVTGALAAIFESGTRASARLRTLRLLNELEEMKLTAAALYLRRTAARLGSYYAFPQEHWRILRSNFPLMRILRQIRERARVVGTFADGDGAVLIASVRLRSVAEQWSGARYRVDLGGLAERPGALAGEHGAARRAAG